MIDPSIFESLQEKIDEETVVRDVSDLLLKPSSRQSISLDRGYDCASTVELD